MRIEGKKRTALVTAALLCCVFSVDATGTPVDEASPDAQISAAEAWAFPQFPPPDPHAPKADPARIIHVAGSTRSYTQAQLAVEHFVPD